MKVIIAEKPSVAKSIAAILGATNKKDGYMEGNGYAVTWAFALLTNGKIGIIKGFTSSKTGKTFDAAIAFDADYKTVFEFENKDRKKGKHK